MEILMLPIAATVLAMSSLVVLSSNSWMLVWTALELNTLSFCSMLMMKASQQKKMAEASMKYFIIQSTASAILIMYLSTPATISKTSLLFMAGTAAILIKLASAPFHSWFIEIVPKVSMKTSILLMTWQKLAPIYILMFMMKTAVLASILVSGLLGSIMQMTKSKLMEIMALSSVFNLSWMMLASMLSSKSLFVFISIYWTILITVMIMFMKHKMTESSINLNKSTDPWLVTMLMAGLAGLPPTLGFYAKVQVILQTLKSSMKSIATVLLVISATNLYIYLRMTTPSVTYSPSQTQKNKEKPNKMMTLALLVNFLPMMIMIM